MAAAGDHCASPSPRDHTMTRLLVSVRDTDEALLAADAGADFIDLKDPAAGALGGLPPVLIARIVAALRASHPNHVISATIGDFSAERLDPILDRVAAVATCGVDYVKVGIERADAATPLLRALADCDATVVPVFVADAGVDFGLVDAALAADAFPAVMLDTVDKRGGSLLERVATDVLADFVAAAQHRGRLAGLAGALRDADLPGLQALKPDFAGFRSAVCAGDRAGALEPDRVRMLRRRLHERTETTT